MTGILGSISGLEALNNGIYVSSMAYRNRIDSLGGPAEYFNYNTIINTLPVSNHKTHLLDIAQEYLGYIEVTKREYRNLTPEERKHTQGSVIPKGYSINDQFCAHTVSTISKKAGMNIGAHKYSVSSFINWAQGRGTWNSLPNDLVNCTNPNNIKDFRKDRNVYIHKHLKEMKEGDFIVWKSSSFYVNTQNGYEKTYSSHIGIIESINLEKGTVTVIEGNANDYISGEDYECKKVTNKKEGKNGAQAIGEFQETNRRDGIIRKVYTISDLAKFGYTGFISNQDIVPKKINVAA